MTDRTSPADLLVRRRRSATMSAGPVLACVALSVCAPLVLWLFDAEAPLPASIRSPMALPASSGVRIVAAPAVRTMPPAVLPLRRYASFLDPAFVSGYRPVTFARSISLRSSFEPRLPESAGVAESTLTAEPSVAGPSVAEPSVAEPRIAPSLPQVAVTFPLPPQRPAAVQLAAVVSFQGTAESFRDRVAAAPPPSDQPSFFDKLFRRAQPAGTVLAYASPDDGLPTAGLGGRAGLYDAQTAVYNIAAHTVTLPDGRRLEAHSGLGSRLDDPRSVAEHMRGVTPPNIYALTPREQLFHGVRALRLTPVAGTTYGRAGLLAHTFMLGPRGDSNGCVVFRDYKAFLQAYDSGAIRRLAVVARAD